jgi:hypothetical protein
LHVPGGHSNQDLAGIGTVFEKSEACSRPDLDIVADLVKHVGYRNALVEYPKEMRRILLKNQVERYPRFIEARSNRCLAAHEIHFGWRPSGDLVEREQDRPAFKESCIVKAIQPKQDESLFPSNSDGGRPAAPVAIQGICERYFSPISKLRRKLQIPSQYALPAEQNKVVIVFGRVHGYVSPQAAVNRSKNAQRPARVERVFETRNQRFVREELRRSAGGKAMNLTESVT